MVLALASGGLFGFGLLMVGLGIHPRRIPLALALSRISRVEPARVAESSGGWVTAKMERSAAEAFHRAGFEFRSVRQDLAVSGKSLETHLSSKLGVAIFGALLGPAMAAVMALGGVFMPVSLLLPVVAIGAIAGFFLPDLLIKSHAAEMRSEARRALSAFLDLAVIVLAGGGGVQTALERAAETGDGRAFDRIRRALHTARSTRSTPWAALASLGTELGVEEFGELASSVALAGTEGARVRESLVAKAATLRAHELASAEAKAASATEAMSVPVALLALGFVVFLAFPAVMAVLNVS